MTWKNLFQGSTDGEIPNRWGVMGYPTMYLLDGKGVIRYVSPRGEELIRAVEELVEEQRAAK